MTTKEYLSQLNRLDTIINQKNNQLHELKILLNSIKSTDYSQEIVNNSKDKQAKFVFDVEKIIILESELNDMIDTYVDKKNIIINQIHSLNNVNHIKILFKRYIENKSFVDIAKDLNYDYNYVLSLHHKGISEFKKIS